VHLAARFRVVGLLVVIDLVGGEQIIRGLHPGIAAEMQDLSVGLLLVSVGLGYFPRSRRAGARRSNGQIRVAGGLDRNVRRG
jgi:hypothetical protein